MRSERKLACFRHPGVELKVTTLMCDAKWIGS